MSDEVECVRVLESPVWHKQPGYIELEMAPRHGTGYLGFVAVLVFDQDGKLFDAGGAED